jgi:hypothetical protein
VVVVGGRSRGDGASARLKIYHAARRRSLEDEGRHMRKGRGDGTLIGSADLMGRLNPYGSRLASPLACGFPWGSRSQGQASRGF